MAATKRQTAAGAGLAVVAVSALLVADRHQASPKTTRPEPRPALADQLRPEAVGADRIAPRADRTRIEKTARTFLAAYVPYTHGHPASLDALPAGVVDSRLLAQLTGAPPHARATDDRHWIERVLIERVTNSRAEALADVREPRGRYSIALTLQRTGGRWQVADHRPGG